MNWAAKPVPVEFINQVWEEVEGFLERSVQHSYGELTLDEIKVRVLEGSWMLIVALDADDNVRGAATVSFYNRTDNRVAYVTSIGGKFLANLDTFSQFCDILRMNGATCIEGAVRESLMRLWARLGARKKSTIVQISL